ncbi:unnamed protein product [Linum trigynum]|uniref:Uncharacterized protein n=1 Tax=Linum trigynum TaxID=586398 RepID=A0AAV2E1R1_9ROSI
MRSVVRQREGSAAERRRLGRSSSDRSSAQTMTTRMLGGTTAAGKEVGRWSLRSDVDVEEERLGRSSVVVKRKKK